MEGTLVVALIVSCAALAAFAFFAFMFWRGALLFLLAGSAATDGEHDEACRRLGKRMAVVLLVACALVATLAVLQAAEIARNALLASAATLANNGAFLALVAVVIWFFIVQRPDGERRRANLDHVHAATIVFVVLMLGAVGVVGMVAAGA